MAEMEPGHVFRSALGRRNEVAGALREDYFSRLIDWFCQNGHSLQTHSLQIRLAGEFGFCYGVDRAVEMAYETVERFPERQIFITNEIIHNPDVNRQLLSMGVNFFKSDDSGNLILDDLRAQDVVIIPAFGASTDLLKRLQAVGCVMIDTTCGSVVRVWKRVEKLAREGYTSIIHGTYNHEETIATASRAVAAGGRYLVIRNDKEAAMVCAMIEGQGDAQSFVEHFAPASSADFDPVKDLQRVGFANQTTMLASESLAIAEKIRQALINRYGAQYAEENYRSFDTICSATQDRQDAILELAAWKPDLLLVVGGFNSSNTGHLGEIGSNFTSSYHIDGPSRLISADEIEHKPAGSRDLVVTRGWLADQPLKVAVTAGASTPNRVTGAVIERLLELRGEKSPEEVRQARSA